MGKTVMNTYCGADCAKCQAKERCRGCLASCGSPFGGVCVAAEYVKKNGQAAYKEFKSRLTAEINALFAAKGLPVVAGLFELAGGAVNLEYTAPGGKKMKFLNDKNIYLGAQVACNGAYYGVIADASFILLSSYGENGENPELILYQKRDSKS